MNDLTDALNRHYAPQDVSARILGSIRAAGLDPDRLSRDEASMFDEFHGGGRESTRALARDIALAPGTRVLDVGCGIGGPARTLAAEFGCAVTGVDLTADFIHAARMLSLRVGMGETINFIEGSALALPLADAAFDLGDADTGTDAVLANLVHLLPVQVHYRTRYWVSVEPA